ncbi:S49 family peptidase [Agrobacterium genomosp. 13]|uniref:Peptidase U7 (Modular protein) n=1 Tax=Agrobacterium genomosp. 13 str. CFBP 6927 TaxID=1183428 RepID=A0ABP2BGY8_9HYPH|nr:S49 family peptidase [Agrobacterium genomosp. 13]CUX31833.1 Peptidase U7 (modular protein) [Agrobacterium genomosp. 13 str. CFBP 6927]
MSDNFLPMLADRILNRPLLVHPDKAATILHVLEGRITLGRSVDQVDASRFVGTTARGDGTGRRFTRADGKTAIITVDGSLVNRGAWVGASSGLTSYEGIAAQLDEIAAEVRAGRLENLVIDMNSYGGEATGMAAVATKIRNLRKSMHVVAVVNDVAASAGYGIVSAADEIVISPTSLVGSIGVVMMHLDRSAEMNAKGIRPTLIHAGAKKVDGNPFGPLPENVRADMQKDVLAFYDQFLETVEAGRGKARLSAKKARETEADVFIGKEAIAAGLADRMASLDEVLAELSRPARAAGKPSQRTLTMDREDLPSAHAEAEKSASAILLAATNERERIKAILALPEAKARPAVAHGLAFTPGFSVDAAKTALAAMPEEVAAIAGVSPAPAARTIPSIAERALEQREIGPTGRPEGAAPDTIKAGWASAANKINSRYE